MKPALFSTQMVQALLNTKPGAWPAEPIDPLEPYKSMTRRVIKPQPDTDKEGTININGFWVIPARDRNLDIFPYHVGDLLWVRETWLKVSWFYEPGAEESSKYFYRADGETNEQYGLTSDDKWAPSIFMPREASRIFLELKGVRVERVRDITANDVNAEGVYMETPLMAQFPNDFEKWTEQRREEWIAVTARHEYIKSLDLSNKYIDKFATLWDHLNAKRGYSWESNPYVFVYEFMRLDPETVKERNDYVHKEGLKEVKNGFIC